MAYSFGHNVLKRLDEIRCKAIVEVGEDEDHVLVDAYVLQDPLAMAITCSSLSIVAAIKALDQGFYYF